MKQVSVSELTGAALDWSVAKASGMPFYTQGEDWPGNYRVTQQAGEEPVIIRALIGTLWLEFQGKTTPWSPSTDWSQGGPLIAEYRVSLEDIGIGWIATPRCCTSAAGSMTPQDNDSLLVAACRAIVCAGIGDTAQIPDDIA